MALINCPECGKQVSTLAKMCPHCGYNIWIFGRNKFTRNMLTIGENNSKTFGIGCLVALVVILLPIVYVLIQDDGRKNELNRLKQAGRRADSENADTPQLGIAANEPLYPTEWVVEKEREPEGSYNYVVYKESSNEFRGKEEVTLPLLIISCINDRTYVSLDMQTSIDPQLGLDKEHSVRIKLDGAESFSSNWKDLENYPKAIMTPNAIPFAKKLAESDTMLFEFTPYNQNTVLLHFDLGGLKPHLQQLAKECGWKL